MMMFRRNNGEFEIKAKYFKEAKRPPIVKIKICTFIDEVLNCLPSAANRRIILSEILNERNTDKSRVKAKKQLSKAARNFIKSADQHRFQGYISLSKSDRESAIKCLESIGTAGAKEVANDQKSIIFQLELRNVCKISDIIPYHLE